METVRICTANCTIDYGYQDSNNATACYPEMVCPSGSPYLKMKSDSDDTIRTCISTCPASVGYQDNNDVSVPKCYSNKKCASTNPYAYMLSTQTDAVVTCIAGCTALTGYQDNTVSSNKKCYYDYQCNTDAPYTYATSTLADSEYTCQKVCSKFNGTIDENKPNGTWCLTDKTCLISSNYIRKRSDDKHASLICVGSCLMYDGNILGSSCYYGKLRAGSNPVDKRCPSSKPYGSIYYSSKQVICTDTCDGYLDARDSSNLRCYTREANYTSMYCSDYGIFLNSTDSGACSQCDSTCRKCLGTGPTNCTVCAWEAPYLMTTSTTDPAVGWCAQTCPTNIGYKDDSTLVNAKCYTDRRCKSSQYFVADTVSCVCNDFACSSRTRHVSDRNGDVGVLVRGGVLRGEQAGRRNCSRYNSRTRRAAIREKSAFSLVMLSH